MFANHEKASFQYVVNKFQCNDSTPKIFPQLIRHTIVLKFINKFNIHIAFLSHIPKHFYYVPQYIKLKLANNNWKTGQKGKSFEFMRQVKSTIAFVWFLPFYVKV